MEHYVKMDEMVKQKRYDFMKNTFPIFVFLKKIIQDEQCNSVLFLNRFLSKRFLSQTMYLIKILGDYPQLKRPLTSHPIKVLEK